MAFENFPYTNFHEINLDWIVARVKEAYSASNPPDYPVTSVNGQTGDVIIAIPSALVRTVNGESGDVILYRNPLVQFPTTDESRWNLFRICDGDSGDARGIEFDEDGAHRIEGVRRILIYDEENQPDYPVTSVNGMTGDVRIVAGVNSVNGKTGNVVTPFTNPNADILTLDSNSNSVLWGISRNVSGGNVALYISSGAGSPQAFIRYTPTEGDAINLPLLTNADIPESAGVISVNTKTGAVTLYGSDIPLSENDSTTIVEKFDEINNIIHPNIVDKQNWFVGLFYTASGGEQPSPNFYSTRDFIIDECTYITTTHTDNYLFRVYVWDSSNQYQGMIKNDNTIVADNSDIKYFSEINMPELRSLFPGMKFKVSLSIRPVSSPLPENIQDYIIMWGDSYDDIISDIMALQEKDDTHDQQISALQAANLTQDQRLSVLESNDTTHNQQIAALQSEDTTHAQQISALQAKDATHDQQISELQSENDTQDQQISELYNASAIQGNQINDLYTRTGIYVISISNANTLPLRYPASGTDSKINTNSKVAVMELSIPGAQGSDWTIDTYDGYLEISGTIIGTTNITLYLVQE